MQVFLLSALVESELAKINVEKCICCVYKFHTTNVKRVRKNV